MKKNKATSKTHKLGSFEVQSSVLRISDPCYDKDTWCAGTVKKVLPGTWNAKVKKRDAGDGWGNRCIKLIAVHEDYNISHLKFKKLDIDVGVDSGQAGIFDDKFYQVNYTEDYLQVGRLEYDTKTWENSKKNMTSMYEGLLAIAQNKEEKALYQRMLDSQGNSVWNAPPQPTRDWYEICSDKTFSNLGAGVIRNGVVSSSGYGDGSYTAYAAKNGIGEVVAVKIVFT